MIEAGQTFRQISHEFYHQQIVSVEGLFTGDSFVPSSNENSQMLLRSESVKSSAQISHHLYHRSPTNCQWLMIVCLRHPVKNTAGYSYDQNPSGVIHKYLTIFNVGPQQNASAWYLLALDSFVSPWPVFIFLLSKSATHESMGTGIPLALSQSVRAR